MFGAMIGDMIGAPYEFDRGNKTKEFPLFIKYSQFTDDSVMTVAVAEALMDTIGKSDEEIKAALVRSMQKWGKKYPDAGYGGMFYRWLREKDPKPYGSYGNGSAMRVSAAGWLYETLEETRHMAALTAEVTHNHPEGIKGAEAIASAIWLARTGSTKQGIKDYIVNEFGYDLSRTCDEIRPSYHHVETCQETVPEAVTAFLEGNSFEDVIRTAVSLGGDCDTLTCIAGSIAEVFYGIPDEIAAEARKRLPKDILDVLDRFTSMKIKRNNNDFFLEGNEQIEEAIKNFHENSSPETLDDLLNTIRRRMHEDGHFLFPIWSDENDPNSFTIRTIQTNDGKLWFAAFTSREEYEKGAPSERVLSFFIDKMLKTEWDENISGMIINPWGTNFLLNNDLIRRIIEMDGDTEYAVPEDEITAELLKDGSFLRRAVSICRRNPTQLNLIKLAKILRDSWVWVPCTAIMSEADEKMFENRVLEAKENNDLDSLVGTTFTTQDEVRMVPDILQNGDDYFFPVFTTAEEMGEYGEHFSQVEHHFLQAISLAKNNEKNVKGIVINAFSESFMVPNAILDYIEELPSSLEQYS